MSGSPELSWERANSEQQAVFDELTAVIDNHLQLPAIELMCIASQVVGILLAAQDPGMSPKQGLQLIMKNIEEGNLMAVNCEIGIPEGSA